MTLKQAIQKAKKIETTIHVGEGYGFNIRVSKKDALGACESYLKETPIGLEEATWENETGSIIAHGMHLSDDGNGSFICGLLSIGR